MAALRFRARHVHRTVYDYVIASLAALGWPDVAAAAAGAVVNFGTDGVTFLEMTPDESGVKVAANTLVITLGNEPAAQQQELGGGLRMVGFPVYVDIYGANQGIATSIASDVKGLFEDRYMQVTDYGVNPPVPSDEYLEFDGDDVTITRPQATASTDFRRYWRVVGTTARVYYVGGSAPAVTPPDPTPTPTPAPTVTGLSVATGPTAGGTVVIITGHAFTGATAVHFGGTSATSFSVASDTSITATSPSIGAGAVDVTVTTPAGTSVTGVADQFTFTAPAPTSSVVASAEGPTQPWAASGFGKSFQVATAATVTGMSVQLDGSGPFTGRVGIASGFSGGNVQWLAHAELTSVAYTTWMTATLDGPLTLMPGTDYFAVIDGNGLLFTEAATLTNVVSLGRDVHFDRFGGVSYLSTFADPSATLVFRLTGVAA